MEREERIGGKEVFTTVFLWGFSGVFFFFPFLCNFAWFCKNMMKQLEGEFIKVEGKETWVKGRVKREEREIAEVMI